MTKILSEKSKNICKKFIYNEFFWLKKRISNFNFNPSTENYNFHDKQLLQKIYIYIFKLKFLQRIESKLNR